MAKYIDASLLRYEIKRRGLSKRHVNTDGYEEELLEIIDSLQQEQQEVELEKEFNDFLDNEEGTPRMWRSDEQIKWARHIASHFYELGLKSK